MGVEFGPTFALFWISQTSILRHYAGIELLLILHLPFPSFCRSRTSRDCAGAALQRTCSANEIGKSLFPHMGFKFYWRTDVPIDPPSHYSFIYQLLEFCCWRQTARFSCVVFIQPPGNIIVLHSSCLAAHFIYR